MVVQDASETEDVDRSISDLARLRTRTYSTGKDYTMYMLYYFEIPVLVNRTRLRGCIPFPVVAVQLYEKVLICERYALHRCSRPAEPQGYGRSNDWSARMNEQCLNEASQQSTQAASTGTDFLALTQTQIQRHRVDSGKLLTICRGVSHAYSS